MFLGKLKVQNNNNKWVYIIKFRRVECKNLIGEKILRIINNFNLSNNFLRKVKEVLINNQIGKLSLFKISNLRDKIIKIKINFNNNNNFSKRKIWWNLRCLLRILNGIMQNFSLSNNRKRCKNRWKNRKKKLGSMNWKCKNKCSKINLLIKVIWIILILLKFLRIKSKIIANNKLKGVLSIKWLVLSFLLINVMGLQKILRLFNNNNN